MAGEYLTPDQLARLQAAQGGEMPPAANPWLQASAAPPPLALPPPPALTAANPSIAARVAGSLTNVGEHLTAPSYIGRRVAEGLGYQAPNWDRRVTGDTRDMTGFKRDEVTELQQMDTPLANVQSAPTLSQTAPQYRMSAGMGVGGGIGEGPGLGGQIEAGRQGQLGAMGRQADAQSREGVGMADRIERTGEMQQDDEQARRLQLQKQAEIDADVDKGVQDYFTETNRMNQEVATSKVDSKRLFKDMGAAESITMGIGAVLGGMMSGLRGGGPNEFMQSIDRLVDRDVADQQSAIDNKKGAVAARQNMFSQLLHQTGDRRLAEMQLRNLQYESIKTETQAKADALKVPEVLAKSDMARAAIDEKQEALKTAMLERKQMLLQQAAAARANAAAAAEEKANARMVKQQELGLKQDELKIKAAEAGLLPGVANKETRAAVAKLGDQLGAADMTRGKESLDRLLSQVEKTKAGEHIPGFTMGDRATAGVPLIGARLRSDQANTNEQDYNALLGVYSNIRTGSGGSDREAEKILKEAEGANTPAERANFIRKMAADLARRENSYRAAAGPEASAQFDANKAAITGAMPNTVQRKP